MPVNIVLTLFFGNLNQCQCHNFLITSSITVQLNTTTEQHMTKGTDRRERRGAKEGKREQQEESTH